jgi:hypothetical protein
VAAQAKVPPAAVVKVILPEKTDAACAKHADKLKTTTLAIMTK